MYSVDDALILARFPDHAAPPYPDVMRVLVAEIDRLRTALAEERRLSELEMDDGK